MNPETKSSATAERSRWMGVLARASLHDIVKLWPEKERPTGYQTLRPAQQGLAMVRARASGTGTQFNLGEMTLTRCSIVLESGTVGHSYVQGRSAKHAELAALLDGLLQEPANQSALLARVIEPLSALEADRRAMRSKKAAATKVDFFTMVRGENPE